MTDAVELWETPHAAEMYMIAGWRQWADAGSVSSELPNYLIEKLPAREIGRLRPDGFYLFQLPGMHGLLRPEIKLEDGRCIKQQKPDNKIYYWEDEGKGLVIFLGDEPNLNAEAYQEAFFRIVQALRVRRVASIGGVYAPVPYDKAREMSCSYSLPGLRAELDRYAMTYSEYEGGTSIGSYFLPEAERLGIEYFVCYPLVPLYDLSQLAEGMQGLGFEEDYKAWHELMGRLSHMFGLGMDLSELRVRADTLVESMHARVRSLERDMPELGLSEYLARIGEEFTEHPFAPLGDVWEHELDQLFGDDE